MYPRLPHVESASESEDGSAFRRKGKGLEVKSKQRYESEKESSEDSDKDIAELSRLLGDFGEKSDKSLSKESGKRSDKESGKSSDKNSRKSSDKESGKKSDNDEESGKDENSAEHKKSTRYRLEQREEITRVRKCPEKDYYAILGLGENCSRAEVKKAYMKSSLLTHPDKSQFNDAEEAFKMVSAAYQVLGVAVERTKYDRNRETYKLRGELDPFVLWDEEFAENAAGTDSGSDSSGDDSEEDEEELRPDSFRLGIYKEATPWVRKLLADPRDSSTKAKIESLNKRITKQNKKDGFTKGEFLIGINVLRAIGMEAGVAVKSLKKDPNSKRAKELQEKLEKQFEKTIRINSYPREWLDFLPWSRKDKGKRRSKPSSFKEREKGKGREKPSSFKQKGGESDTEMPDVGPSSEEEGEGRGRGGSSSSKKKDGESDVDMTDADTRIRKWEPGETRKGEKILGWRPFYKTDRKKKEQLYNGCQFVIEKKGQPNPIALVSGEEVGRRVVDAYRDLPEEEQNDIRYSEKRYTYEDVEMFDELLGFACKPFNTKTEGSRAYYPVGYALYSFTDGSRDLVSRECMRQVFGKTDADNQIAEFYEDIGETPPWLIKSKKLLAGGSEIKRRSKSRRDADSDDESDSDSDSSGIFVSAKKKGRRRARDSESSDNDNSSGDDSGDERRRMPRTKRNSKTKKTKSIGSDNQSQIFAGIMQKFLKEMAEENRRQAEDMSKKFEEVLSRIPVSGAA